MSDYVTAERRMRNNLQSWISLLALILLSLGYQLNAYAQERVLLDFKADSMPPKEWKTIGFAFGTHQPEPKERQKAAVAARNQRYAGTGRMTSPPFVIDSDYLQVTCAGTFDPVRVAGAAIRDLKARKFKEGASTISMQRLSTHERVTTMSFPW